MTDLYTYMSGKEKGLELLLREAVNIRGVTGDEQEVTKVAALFGDRLAKLGAEVRAIRQPGYGDLITATLGASRPTLLCVGHTDIIQGDWLKGVQWREDDGRIYGPGVLDMKGGLVILLLALEAFVHVEPQLLDKISVHIVLNPDEEQFSPASRDIITAEAKRAHGACVLEPARAGAYIIGRKGCGWFRLTAKGIASHAGEEPEKGANAIESLAHKLVQLRQLSDPQTGTTISAGVIRGGAAPNIVPDFAEAVIDVRILEPSAAATFQADLERVVSRPEVDGTHVSVEGHFVFPAWHPDDRSRSLFALVREVGQGLGLALAPALSGAGSDGNYIAEHVPTIDGMGAVGGRAHSPGEYIERASLMQRAMVLAGFIREWARRKGAGAT